VRLQGNPGWGRAEAAIDPSDHGEGREVSGQRVKQQAIPALPTLQRFEPKARNDRGDSDPTYGNGWAILKTRNQITGAEFIHRGDESRPSPLNQHNFFKLHS
jgi:hypothetical protein